MSPEAQRIAIAKARGWESCSWSPSWSDKERKLYQYASDLPDYPADLNALADARKALTPDQRYLYISHLVDLTGAEWTDAYSEVFVVVDATPEQHCEALCRALFPERWES